MNALRFFALAGAGLMIPISSCSSYQQQAGVIGGLAGAGLGAAFGDDHQDAVAGALVGAAVGAGGAALHEKSRQNPAQDTRQYERYGIPPDQPQPPPVRQGIHEPQLSPAVDPEPPTSSYPVARRTDHPHEVESPYPPNHRINVEGFSSGQLAKDPKSGKIFRIP
ncbi:hypothetical protein ACFQY0_20425 [Haloferula chungangensis]|uniref:Glycine zipper 2TM domain-containing protein n=1 Tax=Haloferula chungangensis TaxID=1048331 RepID=A0ABW2LAS9_9BACT